MTPQELKQLRETKQHYLDTFQSRSGERVLEDMKRSYHDVSVADEEVYEHIPAEYRVWFLEGQRNVYLGIVRLLKLEIEEEENETEDI